MLVMDYELGFEKNIPSVRALRISWKDPWRREAVGSSKA